MSAQQPEEPCINCGGEDYVEFRAEGELVCRNCGCVKEARLIDERSEWRTFSDRDNQSSDPNRVGGPTNHLLEGLTTTIGREKGDGGLSYTLNRVHARTNNPDRALVNAFKYIGRLCEELKLASAKDRSCELYKEVIINKTLKGRPMQLLAAVCVNWVCRELKQPRSFKEFKAALGDDVTVKEMGRTFKELQEVKKQELHAAGANLDAMAVTMNQTVQHPSEFVRAYCNQLRMGFKVKKVCEDMAVNAKPADRRVPWDGRTPTSVASAIVYIVLLIEQARAAAAEGGDAAAAKPAGGGKAGGDVALERVALVSSVAEATIRVAYRDLYPHVTELLPPGFATAEDVGRLPNPDVKPGDKGKAAAPPAAPPPAPSQAATAPALKHLPPQPPLPSAASPS